ncbi:MAG: PAC2 family protein [Caldilineaceae bacterium]
MNEMVELFEKPAEQEIYLIAGWRQWADAGSISSGLPRYLVQHLDARKIGEIKADGFYMFQIPATHHLLRPEVRFKDGFCEEVRPRRNEFYYASDEHNRGLVIFTGEEPHMNEDLYADAFFDVMQELGVRRGVAVGGVYGSMPYDKDRNVSCTYSMRRMKMSCPNTPLSFPITKAAPPLAPILCIAPPCARLSFSSSMALCRPMNLPNPPPFRRACALRTIFAPGMS